MLETALIGVLAPRKNPRVFMVLTHERILACGCIYIRMAPTSLLNDLKWLLGS